MKTKYTIILAPAVAAATTLLLLIPSTAATEIDYKRPTQPTLTHEQETWIAALEWCESNGNPLAINKKDRDGTPSYGAFQFKPETLWYFADKYGIEKNPDYMFYGQQRAVVEAMVRDAKHINWLQQFPDCVKRKVGLPPKSV